MILPPDGASCPMKRSGREIVHKLFCGHPGVQPPAWTRLSIAAFCKGMTYMPQDTRFCVFNIDVNRICRMGPEGIIPVSERLFWI